MLSKIWSAATLGIDAVRIVVEVHAAGAKLPGFNMVGLPDTAVRESYARVRSALANCGFTWPHKYVTINLSPADVRKEGSGFDLPIAIGILRASDVISDHELRGRLFVGELSLDGTVSPVRGALSISSFASRELDLRELLVPAANAREAAAVRGVRVVGVPSLPALLDHLRGESPIDPAVPDETDTAPRAEDAAD